MENGGKIIQIIGVIVILFGLKFSNEDGYFNSQQEINKIILDQHKGDVKSKYKVLFGDV